MMSIRSDASRFVIPLHSILYDLSAISFLFSIRCNVGFYPEGDGSFARDAFLFIGNRNRLKFLDRFS